ncbi:MAG: MBL fold metallo-hydrolase [Antricoccus sp.]
MKIGELDIIPIQDGSATENADDVLWRPGVEDPWACHQDVLLPGKRLYFEMGGFLIRTGDRVVVVDLGAGKINRGAYKGGGMLDSLAAHGVAPEDVTDVVFTHLHFDHVGWASSKGDVVFTNATFHAHKDDWEYFVTGPEAVDGAVRKLRPIESQLQLFDTQFTVAPGIDARPAPGHTPGTTLYIVSSGTQRALLLGDIVHSVVELAEPDWESLYDVDPAAAKAARNAIADELCDTDDRMAAAHFAGFPFGRVITTDVGRRFIAT